MRILYLSGIRVPSEESRSISIMRVCQAFADAGHEVTLSALTASPSSEDPVAAYGLRGGFSVIRTDLNGFWRTRLSVSLLLTGLALGWKTRELVREFRPDVVYSRLTVSELAFVPRSIPIVYEMHSLGPLRGNILRRLGFRWLVRTGRFRRLIVTTNALAGLLERAAPGVEVRLARLSAEEPREIPDPELADFRETILKGGRFGHHVGYTGYMDTYGLRGTDVLIRAAGCMPDVAFHLVGGESDVVQHWRSYARDHDRHGNIFFYGFRNPAEIPLFLRCFDIVVAPLQHRPSRRAPIGNNMSPLKLPQYMAYGKAIVASDLPAHRECLIQDETAWLVPCDDVDAWVSAIGRLIDDPEKRRTLGEAARAAYRVDYTPQTRVARILEGIEAGEAAGYSPG